MDNDTISRQAAIDYCYALINAENPSDPSDEWNYSQERINQTEVILHHLEFMPSAQPERKKGKWILVKGSNGKDYHKCSECLHTQDITGVKNYCAVCGADMRGEQNDDNGTD